MHRWLLLLVLFFSLFVPGLSYAAFPGSCDGVTTPALFICIPPQKQPIWYLEYLDFAQKVDVHAATANAHGATSANTPSTPVARDGSGNIAVTTVTGNVVGNVTGSAGTATAFGSNGTNCSGDNFALGIDAGGSGECAQPAFSNLSGSATDAQIPDTITTTGYLPLIAGSSVPLTGQLYLDNLGIEIEESDTNPGCVAGNYALYADASDTKWKKCENGVVSDMGTGIGSSGDITDVWTCGTGDCNTLAAAVGDRFDARNATSSIPATANVSMPTTCTEGQAHQDTDSGGTEFYLCTSPNTWTKFIAATDNVATATALAANPADCGANLFATSIVASGDLTCASVAGVGKAVADTGTNGLVARIGDGTAAGRSLLGTAGNITTVNVDGFSGNPTVDLGTTAVQTDQANTWTTGAQDLGSATSLKIPTVNGAIPTATGLLAYDSTSHTIEAGINGFNKTIAMTDGTVATATALVGNGANCAGGSFPLGVDASGAVEVCTDVAIQTELDTHAALTTAHSSTSANTASTIVQRDSVGSFSATTVTAALTGNASTASALATNGGNCAANNFALGVDAAGVGECVQPAFSNLSGAATDAQVPDTITASNYLPLTAGAGVPLTGQFYLDNLGIEAEESDINPACAAGNYAIYADLSEAKWKKCENGVASDMGAVTGSSGDITDVWMCATGDCNTLTAAAGDSLDAGNATAMSPTTRSATLPGTCTEGQWHQDTDSGGTESYVCTAANTWTKVIASTDNVATSTALAADGGNCAAGNFPLGVDAGGAVQTCTDVAIQSELDTHAAVTTAVHGSTDLNTASRVVQRDASGSFSAQVVTASLSGNATTATTLAADGGNCAAGNFPLGIDASGAVQTCTDVVTEAERAAGILWVSIQYNVADLPVCNSGSINTHATVVDGSTASSCSIGGGAARAECACDGTNWVSTSSASNPSLQDAYTNSGPTPTITAGANGLKQLGFNSLTKSDKLCNAGSTQCRHEYIDESGLWFQTFDQPIDFVTKLFSGKTWELNSSADVSLLKITNAGVVSGTNNIVTVLNKNTANVTIANTATVTPIYTFSVPANTLGTDRCLRLTLLGRGLNNTGVSRTFSPILKYGSAATGAAAMSHSTSTSQRSSEWRGTVCGDGATNTQRSGWSWTLSGNASTRQDSAAIDSTVAQTLEVTMGLEVADVNLTWEHYYAILELLP